MLNPISIGPLQNPFEGGWAKRTPPGDPSAHGTRTSQSLRAIERTTEQDLNLQIQTQEGDTVSISLQNEVDLTAISYRYRSNGSDGNNALKLNGLSISSSQSLEVQVQGSLSDQELADINTLLDQIKAELPQLASGTTAGASGPGADLSNPGDGSLSTLSGYTLDVQRSVSVNLIAIKLRTWQPSPAVLPAPAEPDSGSGVVSAAPAVAMSSDPSAPAADGSTSLLTDKQAAPAPVAPTSGNDVMQRLLDAFKTILDSWQSDRASASAGGSRLDPLAWLSQALDQLSVALNGSPAGSTSSTGASTSTPAAVA